MLLLETLLISAITALFLLPWILMSTSGWTSSTKTTKPTNPTTTTKETMTKRIKCQTCKKRVQGWKEDVLWQQTHCSRHNCALDKVDISLLASRNTTTPLLEAPKVEDDTEEDFIPPVLVLNIISPERRFSNVHELPKNRVLH